MVAASKMTSAAERCFRAEPSEMVRSEGCARDVRVPLSFLPLPPTVSTPWHQDDTPVSLTLQAFVRFIETRCQTPPPFPMPCHLQSPAAFAQGSAGATLARPAQRPPSADKTRATLPCRSNRRFGLSKTNFCTACRFPIRLKTGPAEDNASNLGATHASAEGLGPAPPPLGEGW